MALISHISPIMKRIYEVIIIGGGPAALSAVKHSEKILKEYSGNENEI